MQSFLHKGENICLIVLIGLSCIWNQGCLELKYIFWGLLVYLIGFSYVFRDFMICKILEYPCVWPYVDVILSTCGRIYLPNNVPVSSFG